jgi:hypothetical protein
MRWYAVRSSFTSLVLLVLASCGGDHVAPISTDCFGQPEGGHCFGDRYVVCGANGAFVRDESCGAQGLVCDLEAGCRTCLSDRFSCEGNELFHCNEDGSERRSLGDCGDLQCSRRGCVDLCRDAEAAATYFGCSYHPTVTLNSGLDRRFSFALAIANEELLPADVRVYREGAEVGSVVVPPGGMATMELPWVLDLKEPEGTSLATGAASALVPEGAFVLRSDVPITVHQFNPLDYAIRCGDEICHSYSNDASLLLPDHVMGTRYRVVSRPSFAIRRDDVPNHHSGFFSVVALGDEPVEVEIVPSAPTAASAHGLVPALEAGESHTLVLEPGDVLQIASRAALEFESLDTCPGVGREESLGAWELVYCDPGVAYDLTGSEVRASGPVAVFSGHDCTFVPYDLWACDHLEEAMFPLESWGKRAFAARPFVISAEPYRLRVVSGADGNLVRFDPPIHDEVELQAGEFVELQASEDVLVTGTDALLGVQYLVGQGLFGGRGDPSMALIPPMEQFRERYSFLRVENFEDAYVNVVARGETVVRIDGRVVSNWTTHPLGLRSARVQIAPGFHEATSSGGAFGLTVYGYANYTSYFMPAGLDVTPIFFAPP